MNLYDGNGNNIYMNSITSKSLAYNFSAYTTMIAKNSHTTPKVNFISDTAFGDKMYCGGICSNNKIYFAPNTANSIMVYDIVNDYIYFIGQDLGSFPFKYTGIVAYNGYLYCIPRGVNNILQINPISDEVNIIELGTNFPVNTYGDYRDSHHYNGCISDDGYLYCPPAHSSDKLLKINMTSFSYKELNWTYSNNYTWTGCVNIPNNKIVFFGIQGFRVWDCATDTVITDVDVGENLGIYDMVLDPRDNCLYGFGSNRFVKFDLSNYSYTNL
jgi:hypothetical protein